AFRVSGIQYNFLSVSLSAQCQVQNMYPSDKQDIQAKRGSPNTTITVTGTSGFGTLATNQGSAHGSADNASISAALRAVSGSVWRTLPFFLTIAPITFSVHEISLFTRVSASVGYGDSTTRLPVQVTTSEND